MYKTCMTSILMTMTSAKQNHFNIKIQYELTGKPKLRHKVCFV